MQSVVNGQTVPGGLELKDATAILPVLAAIFTYQQAISGRWHWIRRKKVKVGQLGWAHWWIDALPNVILSVITAVTVLSSVAYLWFRLLPPEPNTWAARALRANYDQYLRIFLVWVVFAVLGHFNLIARAFKIIARQLPSVRRTIGFANASWHIEEGDDAFAVGLSDSTRPFAEDVVDDLVTSNPNVNLALRPAGLSDIEAANILLLGHVVEDYYGTAKPSGGSPQWTEFYEDMGRIGRQPDRPFSSKFVGSFSGTSFFYDVLKRYDSLPRDEASVSAPATLPSAQQLEAALDHAFAYLRDRLRGDARLLGRTWLGDFAYTSALRRVGELLKSIALQQQFAKLAVIWTIWGSKYRRPRTFRIPYSRGILKLLLEKTVLLTDADELRMDDDRIVACTECAQQQLLIAAQAATEETHNPVIQKWRDGQKERARTLGIDWVWYLHYRVDQHLYHMGRTLPTPSWEFKSGVPLVVRTKKTHA